MALVALAIALLKTQSKIPKYGKPTPGREARGLVDIPVTCGNVGRLITLQDDSHPVCALPPHSAAVSHQTATGTFAWSGDATIQPDGTVIHDDDRRPRRP